MRTDCKCGLKYEQLSPIDIRLFPKLKLIFIFTKFDASDVIFITNSDDVYGFGTNKYGRLGFGNQTPVSKPTIIPELCGKGVKEIEFGLKTMLAITESLSLYICGYDRITGDYLKPNIVDLSGRLVTSVECSSLTTYLLTENKNVYYFGYISNLSNIFIDSPTHISFPNNNKIVSISCGYRHTLALTDNGKVYTWGGNQYGQLGVGDNADRTDPDLIKMPQNTFNSTNMLWLFTQSSAVN